MGYMFITAGTAECLLDDTLVLYDALTNSTGKLKKYGGLMLDLVEGGVHEKPIYDVGSPQKPGGGLGDLTLKTIDWVGESFGI